MACSGSGADGEVEGAEVPCHVVAHPDGKDGGSGSEYEILRGREAGSFYASNLSWPHVPIDMDLRGSQHPAGYVIFHDCAVHTHRISTVCGRLTARTSSRGAAANTDAVTS